LLRVTPWLNNGPAIRAAPRARQYGFATLGARYASIGTLRQLASADELLIAAMQSTTPNQIPHSEGIGAGTSTDRNHSSKEQKGINH